jgi:hypothetical protein
MSLAALSGCVRAQYAEGDPLKWERLATIRPGETTRAQVLEQLGAPNSLSSPSMLEDYLEGHGIEPEAAPRMPLDDVFTYQFTRGQLRGFVAIFYNRLDLRIQSDLVVIFFDENDRVSHIGYRRGPTGGAAARS